MSEELGPKTGSIVMAVGSIAGAVAGRQELRLASVAGAKDMVYPWPLTVGKGEIILYFKYQYQLFIFNTSCFRKRQERGR